MLGTGHAVVTECYNTCYIIRDGEQRLMVDTGGGIGLLRQLKRVGLSVRDIRDVFVTHCHLDHLTGMLWLLRMWAPMMLRGALSGEVRIYGHDETCATIAQLAKLLLNPSEAALVGPEGPIRLVRLQDGEPILVCGHTLTPFDIRSTKKKQYGFRLALDEGRTLVCCGDEPLDHDLWPLAQGADWLLHEAFCLRADEERYHPARIHHSTVADACETAEACGVRSLLLYHSEDSDMATRKARYLQEGSRFFHGTLYAPVDLETIEL